MRREAGRPHSPGMTIDESKLNTFIERFVADAAATAHAATVVLGDRLGLYRALADGGPQTAAELAARCGCHPRLVEEWANAQAASGYCAVDADAGTYRLEPEQAACLADEQHPAFVLPYLVLASSLHRVEDRATAAFTGDGELSWGDHDHALFDAVSRLTPSDYADLVSGWVPALDGVEAKLRAGARVADLGCGEGYPTVLLAEAFPQSTFAGFDTHLESIDLARKAAAEAGVSGRVTFEAAPASATPGGPYDLVCTLDAFHDMGDPAAVARRIRQVLAPDGTWMIVDRNAGDTLGENLNERGRLCYSASTFICVPNALAQGASGPEVLGAQAGEARFRQVILDAGFTSVRRAAETPFNLVLEARP